MQVERSVALLKRLTGERGRWEQGSETFKNQMSTIIGDVLLMSAFMAYAGTELLWVTLPWNDIYNDDDNGVEDEHFLPFLFI